jgi:hypothetical protein
LWARKHQRKRVPTIGLIGSIAAIRNRVYRELKTIVHRLAPVHTLAWRLCGSRAALGRSHEQIRDQDPMGRRLSCDLGVPARVWKATLDDVLGDIKARTAKPQSKPRHPQSLPSRVG